MSHNAMSLYAEGKSPTLSGSLMCPVEALEISRAPIDTESRSIWEDFALKLTSGV
jgi:hypothetical protein